MAAHRSLYYYAPNKGAPIAFAILFGLSFAHHLWHFAKRGSDRRLSFFLPWAALITTAGYATRAANAFDFDSIEIFIASTVLIIMGPPVYAAALYMMLGRAMYFIPWLAPVHPGRVLSTLVGLDVLCELLLGSGAPRTSNTTLSKSEQDVGWGLVKTGMILQCLLLVLFLGMAVHFHYRAYKHRVARRLTRVMVIMYVSTLLIFERTILRTVELFQGYEGDIYRSEAIFWTLEASVMLVVSFILNIWHPSSLLPKGNKVYLALDGDTEREGPGWVDKRPFLLTVFDPFDIGSCFSKRHAPVKFWENEEQHPVVNLQTVGKQSATVADVKSDTKFMA